MIKSNSLKNTLVLILLFMSGLAFGQILNPVSWDQELEQIDNETFLLKFTAEIDEGWTVYSSYTNDAGPVPTSINFESEGFELIGQAIETGHKKEGFDKIFELDVIKFLADEDYIIEQKIKIPSSVDELRGYLTYMTCDQEKCLPPDSVDFPTNSKSSAFSYSI